MNCPWLMDASIAIAAYSRAHLRCQLEIVDALTASGLDACLLKSAAVRLFYYHDPIHRCGWDVDIGVRREDTKPIEELIQDIGYVPARWVPAEGHFRLADMARRKAVEANHYELGFYARRNLVSDLADEELAAIRRCRSWLLHWHECGPDFCCYVTVDIHHAISLDIGLEQLLGNAVVRRYGESQVMLPKPAWSLLHLIFKIYWEAGHAPKPALYQFADIYRLVTVLVRSDADELGDLLLRYGLGIAFLWVMRRLGNDFGVVLSPDLALIFDELGRLAKNDPAFSQTNNIGDVWENLWTVVVSSAS